MWRLTASKNRLKGLDRERYGGDSGTNNAKIKPFVRKKRPIYHGRMSKTELNRLKFEICEMLSMLF